MRAHDDKEIITVMISLYCKKTHGIKTLCAECEALREYACMRIETCPRKTEKTFCAQCPVHCYKPEMRERIRKVMRFSGPRMMLYQPLLVLRHIAARFRVRSS